MSKLNTFKGLKKGTKIRVISNGNGHNYSIGTVFTMSRDGISHYETDIAEEVSSGNQIQAIDCELALLTKKDLELKLIELSDAFSSEQKELLTKLHFLEETGAKEYDEDVFKVYTILKALKSSENDIVKAKTIAKLINGKQIIKIFH